MWSFYESTGELEHQGEKGLLRETFLRRLLEAVLPPHFGVGSGLVVDSENRQSGQIDLLIYDKRLLPPILEQNGHGIYPVDAVLRVIEVKSTLNKEGLIQVQKLAWMLHPTNPKGLKIAATGKLTRGQTQYPLVGLYAYSTTLADIPSTAATVVNFQWAEGVYCTATRGIYVGPNFQQVSHPDLQSDNLIHNTRLFLVELLQKLEEAAASRKEFSIIEWLLPMYKVPNKI